MEAFSAALIVKALDGLSARSIATAENIANASTANYRPIRVSFEQALAAAARSGDVSQVKPTLEQAAENTPDADLRLDLELLTASSTATRYSALIEILNRELELDASALREVTSP
ncbi:MAG: flagellar basal body rod protein FlgB [Caulobacterales bacterium]